MEIASNFMHSLRKDSNFGLVKLNDEPATLDLRHIEHTSQ